LAYKRFVSAKWLINADEHAPRFAGFGRKSIRPTLSRCQCLHSAGREDCGSRRMDDI
jgi:hypothetical protein